MSRVKGAALVAVVVIGFFLITGALGTLSSTPAGVFKIVAVMAIILCLVGWYDSRRR